MKVLDLMVECTKFVPYVTVWSSMAHGKKLPCAINSIHKDQTLDIFIKSMVSLNCPYCRFGLLGLPRLPLKICSSVASKLREATPPVTSHTAAL